MINTHIDPMLGHVVKEKLADRISLKAYVSDLAKMINQITKECGRCIQTSQRHLKSEKESLYPMAIPSNMFTHWHIDLAET